MNPLKLVLLILAIVLFLIAGAGVNTSRYSLMAFGLAAFAGMWLIP